MRRSLRLVHVRRVPGDPTRGLVLAGPLRIPCALGRSGVRPAALKREGDGVTPAGRYQPRRIFFRSDRRSRPRSSLPIRPMAATDGWCDDPGHASYNRLLRLPSTARHERMWRDDALYDLVVELDHNRRPRVRGRGSAIFLHAARADRSALAPTEGCIAVPLRHLPRLLAKLGPCTRILVH